MKNNVFVDLPKYINTSNGTKCLIDLSTKLESKNIKIIKLFRDNKILSKLKKKFNLEFSNNNFQKLTKKAQKGDWFLACDTTPSLLLNKARKHGVKILWWQLAPYQFLGSNQIPKVGDYSLPFSSYTDPKSDTYYYYQPDVDPEWQNYWVCSDFPPPAGIFNCSPSCFQWPASTTVCVQIFCTMPCVDCSKKKDVFFALKFICHRLVHLADHLFLDF